MSDPVSQLRGAVTDFPSTLRYLGPNVTAWNQMVSAMVYETLLGLHPTTLENIPGLATHWHSPRRAILLQPPRPSRRRGISASSGGCTPTRSR